MTAPTPERARRNRIEPPEIDRRSFRPGWRVRTRLEALRADGAITPEQFEAGETFRRTWEAAFPAAHSPLEALGASPGAGYGYRGPGENALAALQRLRQWHAELGDASLYLLEACCVDDRPWSEIARKLHIHRETARLWTIAVLGALEPLTTTS